MTGASTPRSTAATRRPGRARPSDCARGERPPSHPRPRAASRASSPRTGELHGAGRAADQPGGRRLPRSAMSPTRASRTAPRRISRRRWSRRPDSGCSGSPGTPRSPTARPRSSRRGWATRPRSSPWSRGPRSPGSARSWCGTRARRGSRRSRRGPRRTPRRASWSRRCRRCSSARSRRTRCPGTRWCCARVSGCHRTGCCTRSSTWATRQVPEVGGRGEMTRRGGIVDVFPAGQPLPVRVEWFGDEIESLRAFDPADQRGVGPVRGRAAPAGERVPAHRGRPAPSSGSGWAALAGRLPERLAADLASLETGALGDAAETWGGLLAPATALDHVGEALWLARRAGRHRRRRDLPVGAGGRATRRPGAVGRAARRAGRAPIPSQREWQRRMAAGADAAS